MHTEAHTQRTQTDHHIQRAFIIPVMWSRGARNQNGQLFSIKYITLPSLTGTHYHKIAGQCKRLKADRQTDNSVYCLEGYRERTLHHRDLAGSQLESEHVKHTGEVIKEKILYTHKSCVMCTITFPLSSLVTVKGGIPFPAWVRVKIIMYPFTFPIKEYGDEVASQQGVSDTDTRGYIEGAPTQSHMCLPCCAVTIRTFWTITDLD